MATESLNPSAPLDTTPTRDELLERIAFLGARPFLNEVVQSPWSAVTDAPSLHGKVRELIREVIRRCRDRDVPRCLTVAGPTGAGKTHLLAMTRQEIEGSDDALFIHVPPYLPSAISGDAFEQHVIRSTADSLVLRSPRQKEACEQAVRAFLCRCYDNIIDSGESLDKALRIKRPWATCWFTRKHWWKLGRKGKGAEDQRAALRAAFTRRLFFDLAFEQFRAEHPSPADGAGPDRDTFVAFSLLLCGDTRQRDAANRWFRTDPAPLEVFEPYHLEKYLHGTAKTLDALCTIGALTGRKLCVTFDQLEDTYDAIRKLLKPGEQPGEAVRRLMGTFLRNLVVVPGIAVLFMIQVSVWSEFSRSDKMLVDRMTEGYGAQLLPSLDDASAKELVRLRLDAAVWREMKPTRPPSDEPYFPFSFDDIKAMRIGSNQEIRNFLQLAREKFQSLLHRPPPPPTRITLIGIDPLEVIANEPTAVRISGTHIPPAVRVAFGEVEVAAVGVRSGEGQIDATTPTGLFGDVEVRVTDQEDPTNYATLTLRFGSKAVPTPHVQHIDGQKLRKRREVLGITQKQLGELIKDCLGGRSPQTTISLLELGKWPKADDGVFVRLAEELQRPLSDFLKDG